MRYRFTWPRCVVDSLAACTTIACLATPAAATPHAMAVAQAVPVPPTASHPAPPPVGPTVSTGERPDVQGRPLSPTQLPPLSAKKPPTSSTAATKPTSPKKAECSPGDFGSRTGPELVKAVQAATVECVNTLFSITGTDAHDVFREEQMVTIAGAFKDAAGAYSGDNSKNTLQLVMFLRAGYYVQDNHPDDVGDYGQNLATPMEGALDAFFANPSSKKVTAENGDVLSEVMTLSDSSNEQGRYLKVYKEVLSGYNSSYNDIPSMLAAVNNVYTPLWRGNWNPEYVKAVTADPSIIDTLDKFAHDHLDMLGSENSYLDSNAGMNVARYVEHQALQEKVRPLMKGLLDASKITGKTAPMWVTVAAQADSYDKGKCSYYGVCDLAEQLTKAALPVSHNCDEKHVIKAQKLTDAELGAACDSILKQDTYFHDKVKDNGPIPDQYLSTIQLSVFGSRADYQTYAGAIYGVDTNNGGITMIGDPTKPDNKPMSIMYQRDDDNGFPARIWNLNHEYTHYLDARDDMKGDFTQQTSVADVWWIEGLAEYISYGYRKITDDEAVSEAGKHTYKLSTLFQTTYENSNTTRTYPWGYLAVRYMFEKHPEDVATMLGHFRTGDYQGGYAVYHNIGTNYDADFDAWLTACAAGACKAQ
ncbi:collagenase [Streptomyces auratus]|uniref:microbial collagenase n=1 Tax=Streptomyces auratus AGR0001 TaxID=1160718 RepID=J1RZD5_9ACTN|nr:collagenase [Streptomyces auratus]QTZ90326.1 collagenase [Streptomyces auratus AGR0001]